MMYTIILNYVSYDHDHSWTYRTKVPYVAIKNTQYLRAWQDMGTKHVHFETSKLSKHPKY